MTMAANSGLLRKTGPDKVPGPSFHGPADRLNPAAPSLAYQGGAVRARPPTGRCSQSRKRVIRGGYSFVPDALIKAPKPSNTGTRNRNDWTSTARQLRQREC